MMHSKIRNKLSAVLQYSLRPKQRLDTSLSRFVVLCSVQSLSRLIFIFGWREYIHYPNRWSHDADLDANTASHVDVGMWLYVRCSVCPCFCNDEHSELAYELNVSTSLFPQCKVKGALLRPTNAHEIDRSARPNSPWGWRYLGAIGTKLQCRMRAWLEVGITSNSDN